MAIFLPALGVGARMLATRGLPWLARSAAPMVGRAFPRVGGALARGGTRVPAFASRVTNARPFGSWAPSGKITKPLFAPTVFGKQFNLFNPRAGGLLLPAEAMLYSGIAGLEGNRRRQDQMTEWGRENFPRITGAMEGFDNWMRDTLGEDSIFWGPRNTAIPTEEEQAQADAEAANSTRPDSADYSGYEGRIRGAGQAAQVSLAGIQQQYDNVINELKQQYNLAETDEEKERIRYIVADIEAQRKAGEKAIADIYAQKVREINEREVKSRAGTRQSVQDAGDVFRRSIDTLGSASTGSRQNVIQGNRGLGVGAAQFESGAQPWMDFMTAMTPISENYAQRIGDIGSEAINFLGGVTEAQGGAQQADLQRLAMATGSTAKMQHASEVAQRIAAERLALAQQVAGLRSQQLSEMASGRELNAQLADSAAARSKENESGLSPRMEALVEARSWGRDNPELSFDDFAEWHERTYGVPPGQDMFAAYNLGVDERE